MSVLRTLFVASPVGPGRLLAKYARQFFACYHFKRYGSRCRSRAFGTRARASLAHGHCRGIRWPKLLQSNLPEVSRGSRLPAVRCLPSGVRRYVSLGARVLGRLRAGRLARRCRLPPRVGAGLGRRVLLEVEPLYSYR